MKKNLLLFCSLVLLISCSNDIDYSATYVSSNFETGSMQLYTKNGEITNKATINDFLARHEGKYFKASSITNSFLPGSVTLKFLSATDAEFKYGSATMTANLFSVIKKEHLMYVEEKEATDNGQRYYGFPHTVETVQKAMLSHKTLYNDTLLVENTNDVYYIKTKRCYYMTEVGSVLKMPFMSYYYHEPYAESAGSVINNSFNRSCISLMNANDTLAVQQLQLVLKKK
jgi:hypothetical protein